MHMVLTAENFDALVKAIGLTFFAGEDFRDPEEVYVALSIGVDKGMVVGGTFTGTMRDLYALMREACKTRPLWF